MRDPKRIKPFLEELEKFWNKVPGWRFAQLVVNILGTDPFYIEDDIALDKIKDDYEDLELSLNHQFVHEMTKLMEAVEKTDFDISKCKTITSEELFSDD